MTPSTTRTASEPFGYCLNTSTIRAEGLTLVKKAEIASAAGYTAIEPWIDEIAAHVKSGGTLADLRKKLADLGLTVAGAVGFAEWIVPDNAKRAAGLEHMKRDMDLVAAIGGRHIATPPIGAHLPSQVKPELNQIAERYRAILELGVKTGVTPLLELWGFSQTLSHLSEVLYVAAEAKHPNTCILLDSYHLYKGGSDYAAVRLVNGAALPVFHINDFPAAPARAEIDDSYRVYPGDGVAPLGDLFRTLKAIGFSGFLSVELFSEEYWKQPAEKVARIAFEKTRAAVRNAFV